MLTPEEISQAEMQKRYDDVTYIQRVRKNVPTEPTTAPFRPLFIVAMIASIALIVIGIVALTRFFSGSMAGLFIAIPLIAGGVLSLVMIIATMRRYKKKKASKLVMLVAGTPEAIGPKETVVYKPNQKLVGDETATKIKKEQKVRVLNDDSAARGFKRDTRKAERIIAQGVSLEGARDALRANIAAEGISILESDFSRLYAHLAYSRFLVLEDVKPELRLKLVRAIANTFSAIGTVDHPIGDFMDYQHLAPRNVESNRVMGFEFDSYEDIAAYFVHAIDEISDYGIDHTFKSKMMLGKNHVIIAFFDGSLANLDPKLLACCSALPLTLEEAEVPEDSRTASLELPFDDFRYLVTKIKKQYFLKDPKLASYDNFFHAVGKYGVVLHNDAENAIERAAAVLLMLGVDEDVASGDLIANMILPYAASIIVETEEEGGLAEIADTCFNTEEEGIAIKKSLTRHAKARREAEA